MMAVCLNYSIGSRSDDWNCNVYYGEDWNVIVIENWNITVIEDWIIIGAGHDPSVATVRTFS